MRRSTVVLLVLLSISSCGGGTPAPAVAESSSEPSSHRCEVNPEIAATAKTTPKALGCSNRAELVAAAEGCHQGDAAFCYQLGVCFAVEVSMVGDKDPTKRSKAIAEGKKAFRVACDGGIADACDHRAGMIEDQQSNPAARKEACEDIRRGCHLGKKVDCAECFACP